MSNKKIIFGVKPDRPDIDLWVETRAIEETKKVPEKMKRLTIDIPESLHKAVKSACALRGTKIADEVRDLLNDKYIKNEL